MEISLIPEQQKERAQAVSFREPKESWGNGARTGLIVLLILVAVSVGFFVWSRSLRAKEESLREEIKKTVMSRDAGAESRLARLGRTLDSFTAILASHRAWSHLFDLFQERTLPEITLLSLEATYKTASAQLKGLSPNYNTLARQIKSLESDENIERVDVSNVKVNKQGLVEFNIEVAFKKSVLKY